MLYIKFTVGDSSKFKDFQKVYDHMVMTRQPGFEFEEDEPPNIDWDNLTKEEGDKAMQELLAFMDVTDEERRYHKLIPIYAQKYLAAYADFDAKSAGVFGFDVLGIFNYLEFSFEVEMENLQLLNKNLGLVEFPTGNYPYGGMERFLMVLKAFDLIPEECFNGFTIYQFKWTSGFTHEAIDLPEATKLYKEDRNYLFT